MHAMQNDSHQVCLLYTCLHDSLATVIQQNSTLQWNRTDKTCRCLMNAVCFTSLPLDQLLHDTSREGSLYLPQKPVSLSPWSDTRSYLALLPICEAAWDSTVQVLLLVRIQQQVCAHLECLQQFPSPPAAGCICKLRQESVLLANACVLISIYLYELSPPTCKCNNVIEDVVLSFVLQSDSVVQGRRIINGHDN